MGNQYQISWKWAVLAFEHTQCLGIEWKKNRVNQYQSSRKWSAQALSNSTIPIAHHIYHHNSRTPRRARNTLSTRWTWKIFEKKREISKLIEKSLRQINDHLRWVSTNRNVRIALSFTTLGSIKVVYSWFESVAQHHIVTQLTAPLIATLKKLCFDIKCIFVSSNAQQTQ